MLERDERTRGSDLVVTANDGVVTLAGTTQSPSLREVAPAVAREVDGVVSVRSEVRFLREGK
jgi:osmotically-inducible protein OsmY